MVQFESGSTHVNMDFLSNGFKLRNNAGANNTMELPYIYAYMSMG